MNHAENGTPVTNGVHQGQQGSTTENEEVYEMIQEPGINIKIISPGVAEPLEIHVSTLELVQEIHQLLMNNEDTCHRTCFSLQLDNVTLDNFADLKGIEGLRDGSVLKVIEEPYTMREARIHVRHVRDLLKCMDPADAYNGIECYSLSFLHHITQEENVEPRRRNTKYDCTPPDYILPETKERLLLPLQPGIKGMRGSPILKVLTTSAWNPPPGPRKLHGDLMYLYVITMEDKRFHITACPRGFYINQSTEEIFIPKPESPCQLSHSLIDLLSHISPIFKRNFAAMLKRRQFRHPFERLATSYQVHTWCAPALEHTIDAIRAEDTSSSKLGYEEHIPGQTRDWNEELQSTRELPRKSLSERLLRERAIFKVHSDFVGAATRGAMAVIDGNVMAINPGEDTKMQMFIWNNIFFSLGFDVRDHYKDLGGDAAAFVAPRNDLHGVRVYSAVDQEGLYTLGTVVVDYRGYRITAQSIIPGILEREQEQSVVYGSIDFGKTVLGHEKYLDMLKRAGQHLRILPHFVLNEKNDVIELGSSVECKGIIGNDGRHYILDLLRTFPPDVNFLKHDDVELSNVVKLGGFPIEHKHKLCCLRQELLDAFAEDRYVQFIRYAAFHLQRLCLTKKDAKDEDGNNAEEAIEQKESETKTVENSTESELKVDDSEKAPNNDYKRLQVNADEAKRIMDLFADGLANNEKQAAETKTVVRQACAKVGSLKDYEFDIRFNPDAFSTVRHTGTVDTEPLPEGLQSDLVASPSNSLKQQRKLIVDAAEFLVAQQIPGFVHSCLDHVSAPMDGPSLIEAIHARGINVRYLGKVATFLGRIAKLEYLYKIAIQELVLRAAKHVFNVYMQNADLMNLSSAISHFLNCLLTTTSQSLNPSLGQDELQQAKRGGKNKRTNKIAGGRTYSLGNDQNYDWVSLTQKSLWQQIKRELKAYWDFDLNCGNEPTIDTVTETFKLNKLTMLRAFCMKVGIQILLREYNFEPKNKPTFGEEDIVNVFPIIKHINPRASDAYNFYSSGQAKIQQGYFKEGFELISEALNLLNNVYGAMHPENAQCLRLLARLSYIMGETAEALSIQQRAVIMSERVNGIDHPHTISEYVSFLTVLLPLPNCP